MADTTAKAAARVSSSPSSPAGAAGSPAVRGNTYVISHDLFLRAMGLVYFVAIFSNYVQWPGLFGHDGLEPAHALLASERQAGLDSWGNFWRRPTLAWFAPDLGLDVDTFFEGLCLVGMTVAVATALGLACMPGFAFLWLAYLTLQQAGQTFLGFQWDILLLEVGVVAALWAPVSPPSPCARHLEPGGAARRQQPSHTVMWLLRFLLFKLMFMSGIVKLQAQCPTWQQLTALDYHYATQCVATPLAWYAHQLPPIVQQLSVAATYVIEIPMTLLLLSPFRQQRHFAAVGQVLLQLLIIATGNYNFFNWLTIVLCLPCLDDTFWDWPRAPCVRCCHCRRRTCYVPANRERGGGDDGDGDGAAAVPPLAQVLGWQFVEQHGLAEFFAALCAHVDARLWWGVGLVTTAGAAYSLPDMFEVEVDAAWLKLIKAALLHPQQQQPWYGTQMRGLLSYGLLNGVSIRLRWTADDATAYTRAVLPGVFLLAAAALSVNAMLDMSRATAAAAPVVAPVRPPLRREWKKVGQFTRPDGKKCCALPCGGGGGGGKKTKKKKQHKQEQAQQFGDGNNTDNSNRHAPTPLAAAIRRIAAAVLAFARAAAVACVFAASCVTFRSLDNSLPREVLPRVALRAYSAVAPYRVVSSYGLFRRMTGVGHGDVEVEETYEAFHPALPARRRRLSVVERPEVVVQGLYDAPGSAQGAQEWRDIDFAWKPGGVTTTPPYVAPYQPRLDWQMWFAALTRTHHPTAGRNFWFTHLVVKLFDQSPALRDLLAPYPDVQLVQQQEQQTPHAVRALLYKYDFTRANYSWNQAYIAYQDQHHLREQGNAAMPASPTQDWWSRSRPAQYMARVDRRLRSGKQQGGGSQAGSIALPQLKATLAQTKGWGAVTRDQQDMLASRDARQRCSGSGGGGLFGAEYGDGGARRREYLSTKGGLLSFSNRDLCMLVARSRTFLLARGLCSAKGVQAAVLTLIALVAATKLWGRRARG